MFFNLIKKRTLLRSTDLLDSGASRKCFIIPNPNFDPMKNANDYHQQSLLPLVDDTENYY